MRGIHPFTVLPASASDDVHVITNVGFFKHCRQDDLCRCRKCKPPLHWKGRQA